MSKRVLRALQPSSIPIPTVTLCSNSLASELCADRGCPGRLDIAGMRVVSERLDDHSHASALPCCRERARGYLHDTNTSVGEFLGEDVCLHTARDRQLQLGTVFLLNLCFQQYQGCNDVRVVSVDNQSELALSGWSVNQMPLKSPPTPAFATALKYLPASVFSGWSNRRRRAAICVLTLGERPK